MTSSRVPAARPTRRTFLLTSATGALGASVLPRVLHALPQKRPLRGQARQLALAGPPTLRDPRIKELVARALDAARSAGARYADTRVTYTRTRSLGTEIFNDEALGFSVRALVDGAWGFASSPYMTADEAPRLGRLAVSNAKSIVSGTPTRGVELGTISVVPNGDWTTPVQIDPFEVAEVEMLDWLWGIELFAREITKIQRRSVQAIFVWPRPQLIFEKQERVVGTTEGNYLTQTIYKSDALLKLKIQGVGGRAHYTELPGTGVVGAGWEYMYDQTVRIREAIPQLIAQFDAEQTIPLQPMEVGRYDVALSAKAMADVLSRTLGPATELDRALGYEANAGGTSYLGPDPRAVLGTAVAAPSVTVTANRSMPRGLATVQWDDEGVVPDDFPLVEHGTLVDYQTTREQAAWLAPWYQARGRAVRSHGCATSPTALELPMQHTPNLTLQPGTGTESFESLIAGMASGIAVDDLSASLDFQCLNGLGFASRIFEIKNGKRVARLESRSGLVGVSFRSPEFWKNIIALGGPASAEMVGFKDRSEKGEPAQRTDHSVCAVPAVVKQLAVIDPTKKA